MYEHSNNNVVLGVDIGGSHITAALVDAGTNIVVPQTLARGRVHRNGSKEMILEQWMKIIRESVAAFPAARLVGIGFAMPGPFDYENGVCLMQGVNKYESLYKQNISKFIKKQFLLEDDFPVRFENDASCFGLGEILQEDMAGCGKTIAVTLGTGFGASFLQKNIILKTGDNVPHLGQLYDQPYLGGIAEDHVSTAWILKKYNQDNQHPLAEVKDIAEKAISGGDQRAQSVFEKFGEHFAACILPWIKKFNPGCLVIGGSIAKSASLFINPLKNTLSQENIQ